MLRHFDRVGRGLGMGCITLRNFEEQVVRRVGHNGANGNLTQHLNMSGCMDQVPNREAG